jgi:ATP-dependent Zn protease
MGPLKFSRPGASPEGERPHQLSETTAQRVDAEVERIVMEAYQLARELLERNREAVRGLAEELLQVESLDAEEIRAVLSRHGVSGNGV